MVFLLESILVETFCVLVILICSFYFYVTLHYDYWKKKGVLYVNPVFPLGSLPGLSLGKVHLGEAYDQLYKSFKNERYFGIIDSRKPTLVVKDPELIKRVLTKDFSYFSDRSSLTSEQKKETIINHLFNMTGQDWRRMRLILTPTFTSGKMKMMFSLMERCCDQLRDHMNSRVGLGSVVDIKDTLARFTMNIIGSCAFGLEINSLSNKDCEFYIYGTKIFKTTRLRLVRRLWYSVLPVLSKLYAPRILPADVNEFFTKAVYDTINYRKQNKVVRNDFLDLMIQISQNKNIKEENETTNGQNESRTNQSNYKPELTLDEITAQSFVFFAAGFETASSTASFCIYELSCNQDIQEKLYQEIKEVLSRHGLKISYQALQEMVYMDQVISETLRLYASLAILTRICTETYKIPDSDLVLEKGTRVVIPVFSIHHDPEYYTEPYKFDPERFSPETVKERHPYVYLPFGEGPRMCIGMRFGLLQTKTALATMIWNYQFDLTHESEVPIKIFKKSLITLPEKPVLLLVNRRNHDI